MAPCQVLCSTRYLYSFLYFLTTTCEVPLLQLTVSHEEAHLVERSGFTQFRSYCLVSWDSDLVFGLPCASHPGPPQHLALETVGETVEREADTGDGKNCCFLLGAEGPGGHPRVHPSLGFVVPVILPAPFRAAELRTSLSILIPSSKPVSTSTSSSHLSRLLSLTSSLSFSPKLMCPWA